MIIKQHPVYNEYWITKDGRVLSNKSHIWLQAHSNGRGYLHVSIYDNNGKKKSIYIHKLVLETFIGFCPDNMECCHKDNNKANNHLSNLRWDTHQQNLIDAEHDNRYICGEIHYNSSLSNEDVKRIRELLDMGISQVEIAKLFDVTQPAISYIKNDINWKQK